MAPDVTARAAVEDVREACRHAARNALISRVRSRVRLTLDQHAAAAADAVLDALAAAGLLADPDVPGPGRSEVGPRASHEEHA